jgi:hypothetical protein
MIALSVGVAIGGILLAAAARAWSAGQLGSIRQQLVVWGGLLVVVDGALLVALVARRRVPRHGELKGGAA